MLGELRALYPGAPIFTSVFDPSRLPAEVRAWDVRPSRLQRLPGVRRYSRALLPLMPGVFRRFDFSNYDVVITASSAFSKNVERPPGGTNVCYCHTPPRYIWDLSGEYLAGVPLAGTLAPAVGWLRARDVEAAARVDHFVANSANVAERIARHYGREAAVVYPPVDTHRVRPNGRPPEDFYLVVARLVPYKRIDLAVRACTRLGRRLVVVGAGSEIRRLREMAGPTVQFAGQLPDAQVAALYSSCKAFIFPGYEDFGIAAVEAQAAGRPVIAYGRGGAVETVVDQVTGVLFHEQSVDGVADAIERLDQFTVEPGACRGSAVRFDASVFRTRMSAVIDAAVGGAARG